MRRLFAFLATTIDGYHEGTEHELDWHHAPETATSGFSVAAGFPDLGDAQHDEIDTILFGRVTYQMMAEYWLSPAASEAEPEIAARMNSLPKVVVSRTLDRVGWTNTRLVRDDVVGELTGLKQQPGKDIAIYGSSTLTTSLLRSGLVDEIRILVNPVIIGAGNSVFAAAERVPLTLVESRTFPSGNVLLYYHPAAR
jgi:dihydrofolate reductase